MKFNYFGSDFQLDSGFTITRKKRNIEADADIYRKYPNAQIIYLLHEKYIVKDKTEKADRKVIQDKLKRAFQTITWITYRSDIEQPILNSLYTTDAGWGCMLRTGQMLLFQALQRHIFDDDFKYDYFSNRTDYFDEYLNLLRLFQDNGQEEAYAYSIHNIAKEGYKMNRKPGDWYGPQAISIVLKRLTKIYQPVAEFSMLVANEGNIYLDKIVEKSDNWNNSVFLVIPLRLGLASILPEYLDSIRRVFTMPQNVGIAGGRENSALYFVGITDSNNLIYLDPHFVQKSVTGIEMAFNERLKYHVNTYHCSKMKMLALDKMCTSVAIGFYIRNLEDYNDFKANITAMSKCENSIFSVYEQKPLPMDMEINFRNEVIKIQSDIDGEDVQDEFCIV